MNCTQPTATPGIRRAVRFLLAALLTVCGLSPAAAQAPDADLGMVLTVPTPITENAVHLIKTRVQAAVERRGQRVRTLVFDFNPGGKVNSTSEVTPCIALKNYLQALRLGQVSDTYPRMHTIALVRGEVSRHSVLPVLACSELILSSRAQIGDVLRDAKGPLSKEAQTAYESIAEEKESPDLVRKMLNKDMVLRKVKTRAGVRYIDEARLEAERKKENGPFEVEPNIPPGLEAGKAVFNAELARRYGLCKATFETPEQVANALFPGRWVREDVLAGQTPVPFLMDVKGRIDAGKLESLARRLRTALRKDANLIILQLDCAGGETVDVASWVKKELLPLSDPTAPKPVKTIAYVPPGRALGAATFLALGCSEIVMANTAVLGDFDYLKSDDVEDLKDRQVMLVDLAERQGYQPLLFRAMLDRNLVLYRVRDARDRSVFRLVTEADLKRDAESPQPQWTDPARLPTPPGEFFKLSAGLAREWGVAIHDDVESPSDLFKHYNLSSDKVRTESDDWLGRIAEFFRDPIVNVFLIMLGIAGLILELKMPGLGLPGVVAGVCFVLFFWAHSFVGQYTILAVLLFVLGLVLIGLEIFVMPGFGVTGVSGIILLVFSLVLVTLEKMPESTQDWLNLGATLTTFGISLVAAIIMAFTLAWYLPSIPYANRLILTPPAEGDEALGGDSLAGAGAVPTSLLGAIGEAATALRPAGKARFGDDFLDVVSEGDYVNPGARVQVVEIEGNRIVVKEV